jgi:hypothetical protein
MRVTHKQMETEHIKKMLYEYYPSSKLVGDITHATYSNGILTITMSISASDKSRTWVYIMNGDGGITVCEQKAVNYNDDGKMRGVLRNLKLNELTNE